MSGRSYFNKFAASTKGSISFMMAFSLVPMMVLVGMATDYSRVSNLRVSAQQAADAASLAVAVSDLKIPDTEHGGYLTPEKARQSIAQSMVQVNMGSKYASYINQTSVSSPGTDGSVTVGVDLSIPTAFLSIVGIRTMHASVSSTALPGSSSVACMIALGADGNGITIGGNANAKLDGCELYSNATKSGSIDFYGSATIEADSACAVGLVNGATKVDFPAKSNCPSIPDPLKGHTWPSPSTCQSANYTDSGHGSSSTRTYHPGTHCNISANGSVKNVVFEPGVYIVTGTTFNVDAKSITANGVGIYLASTVTSFNFNGQTTFDLSAMKTGSMAGIVVAQEPGSTITSGKFNGGSSLNLNGTVYLPTMALTLNGNSSTTLSPVSQFIGYSIDMNGTTDIRFAADFASAGFPSTSSVGSSVRLMY